ENLSKLIKEYNVDDVVFAYSDVPYDYVMEKSAIVNAAGANFILLGPKSTMIKSRKPVIAICAVRTGCGKSQVSRAVFKILREKGFKVASIRHPMPYDPDLTTQISQRFASYEDLDRYNCTIEEREEYEPYINMDGIIYAGVDYGRILREAEEEADIIIWDGGNNDFSFYKHDMLITLADPHRPGHELSYYPGSVNTLSADIIIINKVNTARREDIEKVRSNIEKVNPSARIIEGISTVFAEDGDKIRDKRVLVIEDGPTVTHGSMPYGAGTVAANEYHAKEIVDPRPFAVGSIKETFEKYKHLLKVLPAMGYGRKQMQDLEETINRADVDLVVSGTPIDLNRVIKPNKPIIRVRYDVGEETLKQLREIVDEFIDKHVIKR
ncbi:MAG TPA: GTPase, partial [Thermoplasmatales archaeon]|nr:GTPase [Thermoplasmatales archaeon]